MNEQEALEIQQQGANARAMGRNLAECPFYQTENMPSSTGESLGEWQAKAQQWEIGWKMEDAMRG